MKVGERAVLTCSPAHAYGARGSQPDIPPNATLRFDVEFVSFVSRKVPKSADKTDTTDKTDKA
jgi:hypothetical protein